MSQFAEVYPYSCFYLPVFSRLLPYDGRTESFIVHYGAAQKNNLTSVVTLASMFLRFFIVLVSTSLIFRVSRKFIDDVGEINNET
jgi:hypothetical protein